MVKTCAWHSLHVKLHMHIFTIFFTRGELKKKRTDSFSHLSFLCEAVASLCQNQKRFSLRFTTSLEHHAFTFHFHIINSLNFGIYRGVEICTDCTFNSGPCLRVRMQFKFCDCVLCPMHHRKAQQPSETPLEHLSNNVCIQFSITFQSSPYKTKCERTR